MMIEYPVLHIGGPLHGQRARMPSPDYVYAWIETPPQVYDPTVPPQEKTLAFMPHTCRYVLREYRRRGRPGLHAAVDASLDEGEAARLLLAQVQP